MKKIHCRVHKNPALKSVLNWLNPLHNLTLNVHTICFKFTLQVVLPLWGLRPDVLFTSNFSRHAICSKTHMWPCLSAHSHNIWSRTTDYEAPHCITVWNILSRHFSYVQVFSSVPLIRFVLWHADPMPSAMQTADSTTAVAKEQLRRHFVSGAKWKHAIMEGTFSVRSVTRIYKFA